MTIRPTRSFAAASIAAVLVLSACGSSSDDDAAADTTAAAATDETTAAAPDTTVAAETTAAAVETTAAAADTTAAPVAETTPAPAAAAADFELVEWAINGSATLTAGEVTFNVTNGGNFPHELVIVRGDSYDGLPLAASGAVEVDQLAAGDLIGEVTDLDPGASGSLTVDLPAGNYVLVCNLTGGGSSHAARGQVLEVSVA